MKKKCFILGGIGAVLGMAMVLLIPALLNRGAEGADHLVSALLSERLGGSAGAAVVVSLLVYGLYGAGCMTGSLLYQIERWSLVRATLTHYLIVALGYVLCSWLLCWNLSLAALLLIEGGMTAGFFLVWLILYLWGRSQVRELNRLNEERKKQINIEEEKT